MSSYPEGIYIVRGPGDHLELLDSAPRWAPMPGQAFYVANVNGGDAAPLAPAPAWSAIVEILAVAGSSAEECRSRAGAMVQHYMAPGREGPETEAEAIGQALYSALEMLAIDHPESWDELEATLEEVVTAEGDSADPNEERIAAALPRPA